MRIIIDSSPIIFLSKIGKLYLLKELFDEILIPSSVFNETVTRGKEKRKGKNAGRCICDREFH